MKIAIETLAKKIKPQHPSLGLRMVNYSRIDRIDRSQGFSLIETLVASIVIAMFLSLGANLVVVANLYKVVARNNNAMNALIQSDVNTIKYQAAQVVKDDTKCSPADAANGYAGALRSKLVASTATDIKVFNNTYTMRRTIDTPTDADILSVSYSFTPQGAPTSQSQYNLSIQIIPNAAFTCPNPL